MNVKSYIVITYLPQFHCASAQHAEKFDDFLIVHNHRVEVSLLNWKYGSLFRKNFVKSSSSGF